MNKDILKNIALPTLILLFLGVVFVQQILDRESGYRSKKAGHDLSIQCDNMLNEVNTANDLKHLATQYEKDLKENKIEYLIKEDFFYFKAKEIKANLTDIPLAKGKGAICFMNTSDYHTLVSNLERCKNRMKEHANLWLGSAQKCLQQEVSLSLEKVEESRQEVLQTLQDALQDF